MIEANAGLGSRKMGMVLVGGCFCLLAALLIIPGVCFAASPVPVALDALSHSALLVLDSSGKVSELELGRSPEHSAKFLFTVQGAETPIDMTFGQYEGQKYLFILTRAGHGSESGTIRQFRYPDGTEIKPEIKLQEPGTGIDYDENADALYFATSQNGRLFRVALCERTIVLVGSLPDIGRAGPLGVRPGRVVGCHQADSSGTTLYVGDMLNGGVYEYKVSEKTLAKVSKYIGIVSAMLVDRPDASFPTLFASDASRHLIVPFAIQHNGSLIAKTWLAQDGHLSTPSGIAVLRPVNVVSDLDRGSLVVYDPSWKYLYEIKGKPDTGTETSPW